MTTFSETLKEYRFPLLATVVLLAGVYYSILSSMALQWYQDPNYSHGFLVPLIAGYFVYERREELRMTAVSPWNPGLLIILLALAQLIFGHLASELFTMRTSLIVLLAGLVLYFFGKAIFRLLRLPLAYLLLMVPLPYILYDAAAFPLKLFITRVSVRVLKLVGIAVVREGNIIMFPTITLEVADACSGMRSLVSFVALGIAYAFITGSSTARCWLIIVAAVVIAIFNNCLRVIITGILAQHWGAAVAQGFFHEFTGLVTFFVGMVLLVGVGTLTQGRL